MNHKYDHLTIINTLNKVVMELSPETEIDIATLTDKDGKESFLVSWTHECGRLLAAYNAFLDEIAVYLPASGALTWAFTGIANEYKLEFSEYDLNEDEDEEPTPTGVTQ